MPSGITLEKRLGDLLKSRYPDVSLRVLDDPASNRQVVILSKKIGNKTFSVGVSLHDLTMQSASFDWMEEVLEAGVRELQYKEQEENNPSSREYGG